MIEFRLLGPVEVVHDGEAVALGGRRRRAALALLLLSDGRVVSVERLADELYAGAAPATAVTQVHRQVSELRKLLPDVRIETTPPGYVLRVEPGQLDVHRFEGLLEQGVERLELGDATTARALMREALELWRGPPLADLADEPFAQAAGARLEELRLAALEHRLEADLELGHGRDVVGELEQLVAAHPFRERFVELLVLALYRAGRQVDALGAYRAHRALLADELGLEPGPGLRRLEGAILRHDPELAVARPTEASAPLPLVVAAAVGRPASAVLVELAVDDAYETILLRLVPTDEALAEAAQAAKPRGNVRAAAFVAEDWSNDLARFATAYDPALVLLDAPRGRATPADLLQQAPFDVGLVHGGETGVGEGPIFVLFGGSEHDWAALELGAALARRSGAPLGLVGSRGPSHASRLLADASLAAQRAFGIAGAPILAPPDPDALVAVVEDAALVVAGIGSRWRSEGLGAVRAALVAATPPPVVLVHRGPRPGILAPRGSQTRFTWSPQ